MATINEIQSRAFHWPAPDAHRARRGQPPLSGAASPADQVDWSPAVGDARVSDPQLRERLAEIRTAIRAGTYITPDKIDVVVDRLVDELTRD
jgi:anti-sigma28 factor (negative regulator of flagellin synthesis)